MALVPPIILVDSSGQQWIIGCDNNAILSAIPVSGQPGAIPYLYLNDVSAGASWQLGVTTAGILQTTNTVQGSYPTQALITAPNGTIYSIQVATVGPPQLGSPANGILQTALPNQSYNCNTPISALAQNVLARLEENYPDGPVFWNLTMEINAALVEALNETMLLVGRPTQVVNTPFNLVPNTPWQSIPKGIFAVTDIWGPQSQLRKGTLYDLDYNQSSWGSDWENDISVSGPTMFVPLGFNMFVVHPAPASPMTVLLDGIAYPVTTPYPYDGSQIVPFQHEFYEMFEMYAAFYCRLKETGVEVQEAMPMLQNFYKLAERMTQIQDRRDPLLFSPSFGAPVGIQSRVKR